MSVVSAVDQASEQASSPVEILYVANEGYLVSGCGTKVLIDALFDSGVRGYATPTKADLQRLKTAAPPFDDVDLVLATHVHADHFDADVVAEHLSHNANHGVIFVSTPQAIAKLEESKLPVIASHPKEGTYETIARAKVPLRVINLHHGRDRPIENLGFLFEVCGKRFLHIGDTEANVEDLTQYDLPARNLDYAFIPYWFLDYESMKPRVAAIGAERIIPMHIPSAGEARHHPDLIQRGGREALMERLRSAFSEAIVLDEDERRYP